MPDNPQHDPWHDRWESGRIGFHRDDVHPMLEYFWPRLGLRGDETVFVPLAGKSLDMRWLAARGHRVLGVELSSIAARQFFEEAGEESTIDQRGNFVVHHYGAIEMWVGDVFDLSVEDLAITTAFYDRASLVALDRPTRQRYAEHLAACLPAGSRGLLIGLESIQPDAQGPPFSVARDEITTLFAGRFQLEALLEPNPDAAPEVRALFEHVHRLVRRDR